MKYFTYILECADKTYYVGCTNNLKKRLKEHNQSKSGAHYTKIRRPVVLKHVEEFETLLEARGREAEIKSWPRAKKGALIQGGKKLNDEEEVVVKADEAGEKEPNLRISPTR